MPLLNKKTIYNRLPANTSEYFSDGYGISTSISGILHYLMNDDNKVNNDIKKQKELLSILNDSNKIKEIQRKHINNPKHLIHTESGRKTLKIRANNHIGLEDAKDIYLGMPQRSNTFTGATEFPNKGILKNPYKNRYLSNDDDIFNEYFVPAYRNIVTKNINKDNKQKPGYIKSIGKSNVNGVTVLPILGNATIGYGFDNKKGPYISYYDNWNVDLSGNSNTNDNFVKSIVGGEPFDIYDRIYLTNKYGVSLEEIMPKEKDNYYGMFLPELVVTNNKNK